MRLISRELQKKIDLKWHEDTGLPMLLLMESAAGAVRKIVGQLLEPGRIKQERIIVLAGRGQNGGDAFACARLLAADGCNVICREVFPEAKLPEEAALNRSALLKMGFQLGFPAEKDFLDPVPSLIIDGIFGTGLRYGRPLPETVIELSRKTDALRAGGSRVVAIDIPSGVDCNTGQVCSGAIKADHTVTFVRPKIGICAAPGRFFAGVIHTDRIGVSESLVQKVLADVSEPEYCLIDQETVGSLRPERVLNSHKGMFGKTFIIGGSAGMPGAAVLAARAAVRSGTGLLTLAVSKETALLLLKALPESLVTAMPDNSQDAKNLIETMILPDMTAVIGPGAGQAPWLGEIIRKSCLVSRNLLLDADALNWLAKEPDQSWQLLHERVAGQGLAPAVLTPHPGEFKRLAPDIDLGDRQKAAADLAGRSGCVVVLKGASTVVAHPDGMVWINPTGHDGLAKGGSGDVLSGIAGSLLSQGINPAAAAISAVYLHGLAGEIAAENDSRRSVSPGDIINMLGRAFVRAGWQEPAVPGFEWAEMATADGIGGKEI